MLFDEANVQNAFSAYFCGVIGREHRLAKAEYGGDIATRFHLVILRADPGRLAGQHLCRALRIDEFDQSLFAHGIERDDLDASLRCLL